MSSHKPKWLEVDLPSGKRYYEVVNILKQNKLHTVCQEANCPNISECFSKRTATFMILGNICTRNCRYCNVKSGKPFKVNGDEAGSIAHAVKELGLSYVVITSVTRDDLEDGGAFHFANVVQTIKEVNPDCKVEVLIPDFGGNEQALKKVICAKPDVINHNIEVVRRIFADVRAQGNYQRSLKILKGVHESGIISKSGFMVGLGETMNEISETMRDLLGVADILTIGQYLQPTKNHLPVAKYYSPGEFDKLRELGTKMGFSHVESGPLVRSSYHAGKYED